MDGYGFVSVLGTNLDAKSFVAATHGNRCYTNHGNRYGNMPLGHLSKATVRKHKSSGLGTATTTTTISSTTLYMKHKGKGGNNNNLKKNGNGGSSAKNSPKLPPPTQTPEIKAQQPPQQEPAAPVIKAQQTPQEEQSPSAPAPAPAPAPASASQEPRKETIQEIMDHIIHEAEEAAHHMHDAASTFDDELDDESAAVTVAVTSTSALVEPNANLYTARNKIANENDGKPKCFVIWGPPGVGKSTLCERLSHSHGLVHVSSGSLLLAHLKYGTEEGVKAKPYIDAGMKVPDSIMIKIMLERITQPDCMENGFLCDGFPRTVAQYEAIQEAGFDYQKAFVMHAPRSLLRKRIQYRRIDPETQHIYNIRYLPPVSQEVLERLCQMESDSDEKIENALNEYAKTTTLIFDRLASCLVSVNAEREPSALFDEVSEYLINEGFERKNSDAWLQVEYGVPLQSDPVKLHGPKSNGTGSSHNVPVQKKVPMTLIRCDGYVCERESVEDSNIVFRGAATEQVMLVWNQRPRTVLLLCKKDRDLFGSMLRAAQYLQKVQGLRVVVEPFVQVEAIANGVYVDSFTHADNLINEVDLVVCLGGDGLIMHVSTLFHTAVPPVLSFNLGSLGFLTPFDFKDFEAEIESVLEGNCLMSLRMRLECSILSEAKLPKEFLVLNEVVVDRGASPYLSNLDCFCDDKFITTVQADGIIVSTPTGSTAYSMSAGGSMVHPSVPAVLFTPICPHSLAFRPIIFPDSAKLRISVSEDSRALAWASFDGKFRQQIRRGEELLVQMSLYPVPTINKTDHTGDWFGSLSRAFNFNTRGATQKAFKKFSMTKSLEPVPPPLPPTPSSPAAVPEKQQQS